MKLPIFTPFCHKIIFQFLHKSSALLQLGGIHRRQDKMLGSTIPKLHISGLVHEHKKCVFPGHALAIVIYWPLEWNHTFLTPRQPTEFSPYCEAVVADVKSTLFPLAVVYSSSVLSIESLDNGLKPIRYHTIHDPTVSR